MTCTKFHIHSDKNCKGYGKRHHKPVAIPDSVINGHHTKAGERLLVDSRPLLMPYFKNVVAVPPHLYGEANKFFNQNTNV